MVEVEARNQVVVPVGELWEGVKDKELFQHELEEVQWEVGQG